jgi:hypothetical protein
VDFAELGVTCKLAAWWVACYKSAVEQEMWEWADWLAAHPSVEIECH